MDNKKELRVVGAAIVDGDKVLVAQRRPSHLPYKSLKWEFPGGKIEPGEDEVRAIEREISEELGCNVAVEGLLPEIGHEYPDFIIRLTICLCRVCGSAMPECREHNALRWLSAGELPTLDWAAADARCYPQVAAYLTGEMPVSGKPPFAPQHAPAGDVCH